MPLAPRLAAMGDDGQLRRAVTVLPRYQPLAILELGVEFAGCRAAVFAVTVDQRVDALRRGDSGRGVVDPLQRESGHRRAADVLDLDELGGRANACKQSCSGSRRVPAQVGRNARTSPR